MTRRGSVAAAFAALGCIVLLASLGAAAAAEFRADDRVEVAAGETVTGDLYATGREVRILGIVTGDLVAAGETVVVEGAVDGDLIAAARSVVIRGDVGDDARISGGALELVAARVGGDLVAAGYGLDLDAESRVDGDLVFGGRQALLTGAVGGTARVGAEGLELRGTVGGDLNATVGRSGATPPPGTTAGLPPVPTVRGGLTVGDAARVGGDLELTLPEDAAVPDAAEAGVAGSVRAERVSVATGRAWWRVWLERALALTLVGMLLLAFLPRRLRGAAERVEARPWRTLGIGALLLVGAPLTLLLLVGVGALLVALLAPIGLGGLGGALLAVTLLLAFAGALAYALAAGFVAPVVVGLAGGRRTLALGASSASSAALALIVGVTLLTLLFRVPLLGALVALTVAVLGLGALWPSRSVRPLVAPEGSGESAGGAT